MPDKNRIDSRIEIMNDILKDDNPAGMSALAAKINTLREEETKLDADLTEELLRLYADCGASLRKTVHELRKSGLANEPGAKKTIDSYVKLMKKLSKDYIALERYRKYLAESGNPRTLTIEEFYEKARTRTISLNGQSLSEQKSTGSGQNVRYMINIPLMDEPVPGLKKNDVFTAYFTENVSYEDLDGQGKEAILYRVEKDTADSVSKNYPILQKLITPQDGEHTFIYDFFTNDLAAEDMETIYRKPKKLLATENSDAILKKLMDSARSKNYRMASLLEQIQSKTNMEKDQFVYGLIEYGSSLRKGQYTLGMKEVLGINLYSPSAPRNALMSSVADLFGCGDVLAYSERLNIKSFENGKEVVRKGVLMMPATGEDCTHAGLNSKIVEMDRSKAENSPGLNLKVAKLQFLDFICGNADRHMGNMFYQFSNGTTVKGKKTGIRMTGVQGIDNDTAFGANLEFFKVGHGRSFNTLRVIPKSMADKVKAMDLDTYAFLLHGYGLNRGEIRSCLNRMKTLKTELAKCDDYYKGRAVGQVDVFCPRIVPDQELDRYSFNETLATHFKKGSNAKTDNIYGTILNLGNQRENLVRQMLDSTNYVYETSSDYRRAFQIRGKGSLHHTTKKMEEMESGFIDTVTTPEYTAMVNAARDLLSDEGAVQKALFKSTTEYSVDNEFGVLEKITFRDSEAVVPDPEIPYRNPKLEKIRNNTLPESLQNLTSAEAYTRLRDALDKTYDYIMSESSQKIAERYQDYQYDLANLQPGDTKTKKELMDGLAELKESTEYKKYNLALTLRDRLTEQMERYVKVKEECDALDKASVKLKGMTDRKKFDPYEGSKAQKEAKKAKTK